MTKRNKKQHCFYLCAFNVSIVIRTVTLCECMHRIIIVWFAGRSSCALKQAVKEKEGIMIVWRTYGKETVETSNMRRNEKRQKLAKIICGTILTFLMVFGMIYSSNKLSEKNASASGIKQEVLVQKQKVPAAVKMIAEVDQYTQYTTYYVTNCYERITLRESASPSGTKICDLPLQAAVSYVETAENGYYKIIYHGHTGYALAAYLTDDYSRIVQGPRPSYEADEYYTYYVTNCYERISLRESASTSATKICNIPLGAVVSYLGNAENGFYEIIYNGTTGYALAAYLTDNPCYVVQGPKPGYTADEYTTYYVTNCYERISLREKPSTKSSKICNIPLGAAVSYLDSASNGFYKVNYNGHTGYALAAYLTSNLCTLTQGADPNGSGNKQMYDTLYVVNCNISITLRKKPSTSASEICQIPLGSAVSYIETSENGFYKVTYNGHTGYALASYLSY